MKRTMKTRIVDRLDFDDWRAHEKNICDPGQPTASDHEESMLTHRGGVNPSHWKSAGDDDMDATLHVSMD